MVLSAALDSGYVFLVLIAILTSVISAVYYLNIIKEVFFYKTDYKINSNRSAGTTPLFEGGGAIEGTLNSKPLDQEALNSDSQSRDALKEEGTLVSPHARGGARGGNLTGALPYNVSFGSSLEFTHQGAIHNVEVGSKSFLPPLFFETFLHPWEGGVYQRKVLPLRGYKLKQNRLIILSSYLTITISIFTLLILLFICFSINLLDLVNILSLSFL